MDCVCCSGVGPRLTYCIERFALPLLKSLIPTDRKPNITAHYGWSDSAVKVSFMGTIAAPYTKDPSDKRRNAEHVIVKVAGMQRG